MQKINELEIHKDSEIWKYEGQVEFTQELVEFFEEERKRAMREEKSDHRHIAFKNLDDYATYKSIINKNITVDEKVEINILLEQVNLALNKLTDVEKKRYILNKIYGYTIKNIAEVEKVSPKRIEKSLKNANLKMKMFLNIKK